MEGYCLTFLHKASLLLSFILRLLLLPCRLRWWFPSDNNGGGIAGNLDVPQVTPQTRRKILHVATYGEIMVTAKEEDTEEEEEEEEVTCAVCLSEMRQRDRVWELRNCCHVFHKACIDRWLDHRDQMTCPLCRAPVISTAVEGGRSALTEPSWAVEQLLYLFNDGVLES
ncbi:RING-H2 finger protein ATL63 [Dendrobium catenatum]|uniref:RING-H2 finger protein ATL18 n=1 Tax=Dendrobium catenatum TaxID=906689 RepID=A0A2I0V7Q3_9ASPA|nr:RING-H2 finger protein ATL63 [Dendrobium catenatum]PKU59433.1 RING-H2 finger protein ATL18 [Dendrobium catenatum]